VGRRRWRGASDGVGANPPVSDADHRLGAGHGCRSPGAACGRAARHAGAKSPVTIALPTSVIATAPGRERLSDGAIDG